MPLICQKCNSPIPENNKFCGSCGEPVEELLDATPLNEVTEESSVETLSLDELLTGETIQQSPWAWMLPIIPWMIFLVISIFVDVLTFGTLQLLIMVLFVGPRWLSWRKTAFILTEDHVTIRRGTLTGVDEVSIAIANLKEISQNPGILGQSLGYTTISLVLKDARSANLSYVPIQSTIQEYLENRLTNTN